MSALLCQTSRTQFLESTDKGFNVFAYFKQQEAAETDNQIFVYQGPLFRANFVVSESRAFERPFSLVSTAVRRSNWTFNAHRLTRPTNSLMLWDYARCQYSESYCFVTIAEICKMVAMQRDGSGDFLCVDGNDNVFFVVDAYGYERIVHVRYSIRSNGWGILSWPIFSNNAREHNALWQPEKAQIFLRKLN